MGWRRSNLPLKVLTVIYQSKFESPPPKNSGYASFWNFNEEFSSLWKINTTDTLKKIMKRKSSLGLDPTSGFWFIETLSHDGEVYVLIRMLIFEDSSEVRHTLNQLYFMHPENDDQV